MQLHEAALLVLTNSECRATESQLFEDQICAGDTDQARGTCEVGI